MYEQRDFNIGHGAASRILACMQVSDLRSVDGSLKAAKGLRPDFESGLQMHRPGGISRVLEFFA